MDTWEAGTSIYFSMFRPNVHYKFYWICRSCKKTYGMSRVNRLKVKPDTCPLCSYNIWYRSTMLCVSIFFR